MDEYTQAEPVETGAASPAVNPDAPVGVDDITRYLDAHQDYSDEGMYDDSAEFVEEDGFSEPSDFDEETAEYDSGPDSSDYDADEDEFAPWEEEDDDFEWLDEDEVLLLLDLPEDFLEPDDSDNWDETWDTSDEDASVGGIDTSERSPMIPRPRFDQVLERAKTAESRLGDLERVVAFQPVIERFEQLGFAPEQIVAAFDEWAQQGPQAGPTPGPYASNEEPFDAWCQEQGLDPYELAPGEYAALQVSYRAEQRAEAAARQLQSWEQQRQEEHQAVELARREAEKERIIAQWSADLEGVKAHYPMFRNEALQQDLILAWEADPDENPMSYHAQALLDRWQTTFRNQLSRAAVEQSTAARQRPVVAGGNAPSPARNQDYGSMSPLEMERQIQARLNDAARAGQ